MRSQASSLSGTIANSASSRAPAPAYGPTNITWLSSAIRRM